MNSEFTRLMLMFLFTYGAVMTLLVVILLATRSTAQPTMIIAQAPQPEDAGCGGILIVLVVALLALALFGMFVTM